LVELPAVAEVLAGDGSEPPAVDGLLLPAEALQGAASFALFERLRVAAAGELFEADDAEGG
jgi:hypothetical protein